MSKNSEVRFEEKKSSSSYCVTCAYKCFIKCVWLQKLVKKVTLVKTIYT